MISTRIVGLDATVTRLDRLPEKIAARLRAEAGRLGDALRERIERKLSGQVLQRRSGRLAGSISVEIATAGLALSVTAGSDAPYAAINEYGGSLPAREVLPKSGRVLAFPWRGGRRFFTRVSLPAVAMPERSFMRSALTELEPDIRAAAEVAAREAMTS